MTPLRLKVVHPWSRISLCDLLFALQGLLIECLGRKVLITGGYILMSICCILFTLTLAFQVQKRIITDSYF